MFLVCTDSWDLQAFHGTVPGRLLFVIKRIFFQEKCSFFPSSDSCNLTLYLDSVRMFKCCFCVCILYNPKPFISDDADWSLTLLSSFFLFFNNNLEICASNTSFPWCVFVYFNIFSYNQDLFALLYCYQEMLLPLPANILLTTNCISSVTFIIIVSKLGFNDYGTS